jgi:transposase-like protein
MVTLDQQIIADYIGGMSMRSIAHKCGRGHQFVHKVLKRHNVKMRDKREASALFHGKPAAIDEKSVVQGYLSGKSMTQVARLHGCNKTTVHSILLRNHVNIRPVHGMVKSRVWRRVEV